MKKLLLVFFVIGLAINCLAEYTIHYTLDFANGKGTQERWENGKIVKIIETNGAKDIFEKYDLSYHKPLIIPSEGVRYKFEWVKIDTRNQGWKFWRYDYYILQTRIVGYTGSMAPIVNVFWEIIRKFDPPKEQVQEIYQNTAKMLEKGENPNDYLVSQYDHFDAPRMKKIIEDYFADSGRLSTPYEMFYFNRYNVLRYLAKNRTEFPAIMPYSFYQAVKKSHSEYEYGDFFLSEYRQYPTKLNAFFVALTNGQAGEKLFQEYEKAGILSDFLKIVLPENLRQALPYNIASQIEFWRQNSDYIRAYAKQNIDVLIMPTLLAFSLDEFNFPNIKPDSILERSTNELILRFFVRQKDQEFESSKWQDVTLFRVEVIDAKSGKLIQILDWEDLYAAGVEQLIGAPWYSSHEPFPAYVEDLLIKIQDVDFDGFDDIMLHVLCGAQNHIFRIFRYIPKEKRFKFDRKFSECISGVSIIFDTENKQIKCFWHISANESPGSTYNVIDGEISTQSK